MEMLQSNDADELKTFEELGAGDILMHKGTGVAWVVGGVYGTPEARTVVISRAMLACNPDEWVKVER